ncbi:MAG: ABC transporter [Hyphomicrobium sp. 32-62-53]|nr:MAG: ABC transporter [Hyphomicrobium sp. 12-62-95]OYY00259.1 MAG: ABC transporter [Hyphomicrobium sp. 32-62-53]
MAPSGTSNDNSPNVVSLAPSASTVTPSADQSEDGKGGGRLRSLQPLISLKPYLLKHKGMLVAGFIALVLSAVTMLSVPLAIRRMIDNGFSVDNAAFIDQYFAMMMLIGAILAASIAARFYCVNWIGERVVADLRRDVFAHLARLGPAFFEKTHSGEVMSRLTADTTQIKAVAGHTISQALRNLIMLFGAFVMMFITSPHLSGLTLIAIPVIVLPLMAYGRSVKNLSRKAQDTLAEASAYAAENLSAVRTMQSFAHEQVVSDRFQDAVQRSFDAARDRMQARAGLTALTVFLTVASIVAVLWYGASAVISGTMSGGELGQFIIYALFVAGAIGELAEVWGEISQASGAAERLTELLAVVPEIRSPENPVPLPVPAKGGIEFDNVTFAYASRPGTSALGNFSLKVKPGETVALVGPSGAGKTTIFNLLLRFYDPTSGHVRVDGVDVAQADLDELRHRISLVPQEVAIFADTVLENIRYGSPETGEEAVRQAAIAAQADTFIRALPDGYNTRLGERGVSLSGGQRQRLAIARAILKNAPILLLDEATSALDAENERAVQQALEVVMRDRTTLVIAHRLATVQKADRILVMEEGRVVESGTHTELVTKGGLYGRLAALQFGKEAAE